MRCLKWDADEVSILLELERLKLGGMVLSGECGCSGSKELTDNERKKG